MAASRAPKSPEKAMAIILFSILALVIVLMSLTSSADLRVHEGHLTHRDPRTFAMHRKERLGRRNSVDDVEGDVRVSKRRHDDDDGGDIDDDDDDEDEDDDRKERGSRASSSSLPSRRVEDPFGLPHFKTHEVRDDPVGSWVHHAWEATEHVVDEFAEEFEEFGEDTARVFEPRGKMSSFGDGGHHSPTDDVKRRKRRPWNEIDDSNIEDELYVAARRRGKAGRVGGGGSGDASGVKHQG